MVRDVRVYEFGLYYVSGWRPLTAARVQRTVVLFLSEGFTVSSDHGRTHLSTGAGVRSLSIRPCPGSDGICVSNSHPSVHMPVHRVSLTSDLINKAGRGPALAPGRPVRICSASNICASPGCRVSICRNLPGLHRH